MTRIGKLFVVAVGLILLQTAVAGVVLPPGTPIFEKPDYQSRILGVVNTGTYIEETRPQLILVERHPLARYFRFHEFQLPDGRIAYTDPTVMVTPRGTLSQGNVVEWWRLALLPLPLAGVAILSLLLWKSRGRPDRYRWLKLALQPVLLRQFALLLLINSAQNIVTRPADETGYYGNLLSFLSGDYSTPWHFTVGTSIFYLPFELLSGTRNFVDLVIPISWTEGFIIAPLSLFFGFLIARKLTRSSRIACVAMLLWALFPFFHHHQPDFVNKVFLSFFGLPSGNFDFRHYVNLISCGFTAMSDTPSTMLVLATMTLLLYRRATAVTAGLAAFLFAVACMFRINNILFLPAIALLILFYRRGYVSTPRRLLQYTAVGAAAFLIGFLPQFLVNWKFFGNPLRFSYTNYAGGAHTYLDWIFVELNSAYYGATNLPVWTLGGLALLLMHDRKNRLLLCWWAIPVILFFFGYSHGTDDPIRFVLTSFPAFFIAIAAAALRLPLHRRDLPFLLLILAGWILAQPNPIYGSYSAYLEAPWRLLWRNVPPGGSDWIAFAAAAAGIAGITIRSRRTGATLLIGSLIYFCGNAYLLALLLLAAMLRAAVDTAAELLHLFRKTPAHPLPPPPEEIQS